MAKQKIGELYYEITGDETKAKKALKDVENRAKGVGKETNKLKKIFTGTFAIAAVVAIGKTIKANIAAAKAAEETTNKFNVVFDTVKTKAEEMAKNLSRNYGLAVDESKELLAGTGDLLVGFGVAKDEALELSNRVATLGSDLASFSNFAGGAVGASKALQSALLGETEAAKGLGLALGETQLRKFAEDQGKVFKNLTIQEKAFLRLDLAVSQSGSAIGDFGRSIDSLANKERVLEARTRDISVAQGKFLLPITKAVTDVLIEQQEAYLDTLESVESFVTVAKKELGEYSEIMTTITDIIGDEFTTAFSVAEKELSKVATSLKAGFNSILTSVKTIGNDIKNKFVDQLKDVPDEANKASIGLTILSGVMQGLSFFFRVVSLAIAGGIKAIQNFATAIVDSAGIIGSFYRALSGKETWEAFGKSIDKAKDSYKTFGNDFVRETKFFFNSIDQELGNFGSNQDKIIDKLKEAFKDTNEEVEKTANNLEKVGDAQDEAGAKALTWKEKVERVQQQYSASTSGIIGLLSAIDAKQQAVADSQVERLDRQKQAELESLGLAEESTTERLTREVEEAEKAGNIEAKQEAKNALKRAQIEEKFEKRKAEVNYEAALASWELQKTLSYIQALQAPLNAYVSSLATPIIGPYIAPINAALAAAAAGLQYQAVAASRPQKPSFQYGGVVPGSSYSGDNVQANVNSGEMVLTQQQQATLFNTANGSGGSGQNAYRVIGSREVFMDDLYQASQNGDLFIAERAVTDK